MKLDASLEADDGSVLLPLVGLDRVLVSERRPARLNLAAVGPLGRELRFEPAGPGVFRIEASFTIDGERRPWIYSNPVYLN